MKLTEMEKAVLHRIALGESNRAISGALFISVNTLKTHIRSLYKKIAVPPWANHRAWVAINYKKLKVKVGE